MGFDEDMLMEYGSEDNYLYQNGQYKADYENIKRKLSRMEEDFNNFPFDAFIEKYSIDIRTDEDDILEVFEGLTLKGFEDKKHGC